jgi:hypothetical protein
MFGESPRDVKMEDTMLWANFNSYRDYVSLDAACKLFGLPGKGDMDGSQGVQILAGREKRRR